MKPKLPKPAQLEIDKMKFVIKCGYDITKCSQCGEDMVVYDDVEFLPVCSKVVCGYNFLKANIYDP